MDKEYEGEIHINGMILPIKAWNVQFCSANELLLRYKGNFLPSNQVPNCKVTLCEEKAKYDCELCLIPICDKHTNMAGKGRVCHYCRLAQWIYQQR